MFIENLITNTLGTILGGLLLSIIYFIIYEKIFPKKNLTGEWEAALIIKNTKYKPYEGLTVFYKIHLLHKGNELSGTGEKVKEERDDGYFHEFEFDKRVTLSLDGYFERKFLSKSKIYISIVEDGRIRESRTTYFLILENENLLIGKFISTAANTTGDIELKRVLI